MQQKISLQPRQKMGQRLALSVAMRQDLRILQASSQQLQLEIASAVEQNPLLEYIDYSNNIADKFTRSASNSVEDSDWINQIAQEDQLRTILQKQVGETRGSDDELALIMLLIDWLDENGYLENNAFAQIIEFAAAQNVIITTEELNQALHTLQSFEPVGVGARSLVECLRLQLQAQPESPALNIAWQMCDHLDHVAKADWTHLSKILSCSVKQAHQAHKLIAQCHPKPGLAFNGKTAVSIKPDVVAFLGVDGEVLVRSAQERPIRLNPDLQNLQKSDPAYQQFKAQIQQAKQFLHSLDLRRKTVERIAQFVMEHQAGFLAQGASAIVPLTMREVALQLDIHESTVSRTVNQKYIETAHGLFALKYFFSSAIKGTQGAVSSVMVKESIKALISKENKNRPLSDANLVALLAQQEIIISRRTITKYREQLGIANSTLRKTR